MSWESLLTPQETRLYSHLFQTVSKTQEGIVTGAEAVRFFATSGVPTEILSEVLCTKVYIYFKMLISSFRFGKLQIEIK